VVGEELNVSTVDLDATSSDLLQVLLAAEGSETPVLGDDDLLATGELVLGAAESLESDGTVWEVRMLVFDTCMRMPLQPLRREFPRRTRVTSADTQDDLANVDTGDSAVGLAPGTTHTSLQSIGTGTRQHLVDTDDVVGVGADTQVETLLSGVLDEVLVGADTSGLKSLGTQLLVLVRDKMDAEREVINLGALAAQIEDADLGVGDTTVEARLGIRLDVAMLARDVLIAKSTSATVNLHVPHHASAVASQDSSRETCADLVEIPPTVFCSTRVSLLLPSSVRCSHSKTVGGRRVQRKHAGSEIDRETDHTSELTLFLQYR
jgi:hypothetical protein